MSDHSDPVDRALQSLGGRQWTGNAVNPELEQRLMQSFGTRPATSLLARHRVLIPVVAILAVATAGFAAVGGMELIKSWFMTVAVNGNVVHTGEIVTDENGQATITLPDGALRKDGENQVSVTLEGNADDEPGLKTITMTSEGSELIVQVGSQPDPNAESGTE